MPMSYLLPLSEVEYEYMSKLVCFFHLLSEDSEQESRLISDVLKTPCPGTC